MPTTSGDGGAAVPAADTAFDGLKTGLEGQGLTVANLPATSLNGAETGVDITGDKTGTARLFSSSAKAEAYAKQAEKTGDADDHGRHRGPAVGQPGGRRLLRRRL